jgi:hypothetical protein
VAIRAWCFHAPATPTSPDGTPAGCYIANNLFHDSGGGHQYGKFGAINLEYGAVNTLIENNIVYNIGPLGANQPFGAAFGGLGIQISNNSYGFNGCNPCTFRSNRFYNLDDCIQLESTASSYLVNIYNNSCVGFAETFIGVQQGGTESGTFNLVNNIIYWQPTAGIATGPISKLLSSSTANGGTINNSGGSFANNDFYCSSGCSGTIITWDGTSYTSTSIQGVNGNQWGDPMISLAATKMPYDQLGATGGSGAFAPWNAYKVPAPSLRLTAASGSAYQHGVVVSPGFADAFGTARSSSGLWDIGAAAYTPTPAAISAPANLTLH